ncbi:hypothetical protein [Clostridium estertheticum]|uniref:hypothetical protein n=1 Tax=Clostridium estertheticum TaxID=238834 RepID=UPI001CF3F24D|nr:hypothetical protein [Clostridium estertheticum]MCB2356524.1 hypothetical protein [Clostridium estertheticum]WAG43609.1 hypothetical protein LL065_24705 [Clostridium estertheticum]
MIKMANFDDFDLDININKASAKVSQSFPTQSGGFNTNTISICSVPCTFPITTITVACTK